MPTTIYSGNSSLDSSVKSFLPHRRTLSAVAVGLGAVVGIWAYPIAAQQLLLPQGERWLEVQRIQGRATVWEQQQQRPAQVGDRLQRQGSGLSTAALSASTLALDSAIGTIQVAENTRLQVSALMALENGARITALQINQGQARLQIRRFNNPDSRLEIDTPAGTAAVRGTDFGIVVTPSGKTSVGTESGAVAAEAQGVSVMVNPGFASIIVPGEPPSPAIPIDRILQLQVRPPVLDGGRVRISGRIDPSNTLLVDDILVETGLDGRFRLSIPTLPRRRFAVLTVQNPLGDRRDYSLSLRGERR